MFRLDARRAKRLVLILPHLRFRKERVVGAKEVVHLQLVNPAADDLLQIVAERKKIGVDGLGELRVDPIGLLPHQRGRLVRSTWRNDKETRARSRMPVSVAKAIKARLRRSITVSKGMASIAIRSCSRLGKSRNLFAFAVATSFFDGLK